MVEITGQFESAKKPYSLSPEARKEAQVPLKKILEKSEEFFKNAKWGCLMKPENRKYKELEFFKNRITTADLEIERTVTWNKGEPDSLERFIIYKAKGGFAMKEIEHLGEKGAEDERYEADKDDLTELLETIENCRPIEGIGPI